jgi:chloramphenicol O-acetyltransferase type A
MKRIINLVTWKRKEHFEFFSSFDDPFFGVTTTVDFTQVYEQSRKEGVSFFLYSVYFLLKCINALPAFRLRIENGQVVEYDEIHLSPTIGREDGTFGFAFLPL